MSANHRKRLSMPRSWALPRKTSVWIAKQDPGGHSDEFSMPLTVILRDVLGFAQSRREVKRLLASRKVLVDGRVATSPNRGVGLMDVLTVGDDNFRCVLDKNGKLRFPAIDAKSAGTKVCRIDGKTTIKNGVTQYNLHDGRNILIDDAKKYNTGDSLVIAVPGQDIKAHHAFDEGANAVLIGGNHVGSIAAITGKIEKRSSMPNEVTFEGFGTVERNVFVIGDFALPEVEV